jgi:hypothetical protein
MAPRAVPGYLFATMGQMRDTNRNEAKSRRLRHLMLARAGSILPVVVALLAHGATAAEPDAAGGSYRWAASRGALDFGLRFDTARRGGTVQERHLDAAGPMVSNLPTVSLGLRTVTPSPTAASSLLERAIGTGAGPAASSSVGIEWKPAQSQLMFLRQGLGIRLGGDDRLTMQLRKGTLGIYMKRDF